MNGNTFVFLDAIKIILPFSNKLIVIELEKRDIDFN